MKKYSLLGLSCFLGLISWGQIVWNHATNSAWLTTTNWNPTTNYPGSSTVTTNTDIAQFSSVVTSSNPAINMNTLTGNLYLGAIHWDAGWNSVKTLSNSSAVAGIVSLNGVTLNSVANTILYSQSASAQTIQRGSGDFDIRPNNATNNVIQVAGAGNIAISSRLIGSNPIQAILTSSGGFTLGSSVQNTYSGTLTVQSTTAGSRLTINTNATAFPNDAAFRLNINTGATLFFNTINAGGTLGNSSQIVTFNPNQTSVASLNANHNTNVTVNLASAVALSADTRLDATNTQCFVQLSGTLSGSGNIIKGGTGSLTFSGDGSGWTGTSITVNEGTLRVWRTAGVFPSTTNVSVATGATFRLLHTSGTTTSQTINNLDLSGGGNLTIDNGCTLTVTGTFTPGSGTITNNGVLILQGGAPQSFPGASATIAAMDSLTINNAGGVTLNKDLTVSTRLLLSNGVFSIGNNTLTLSGVISRTSGFLGGGSTSKISITGTGSLGSLFLDQTTDGTTNVLQNLTLNKTTGAAIGNKTVVTEVLTLSNGTLSTSGNLYLRSTATNTARVASIAGTGAISGDVTVERFFSNKRAWRFLTAPTFNAATVNLSAGWQTQTHIVGPGGNPMTNGLDADKPGFSFMTYAPNTWTGVNNTTTTTQMPTANGGGANAFAAFLIGNRSVDINNLTASSAVTLSSTGSLLTGTQTVNAGTLNANEYFFVANPYASPVDLNQVFLNGTTANINRTFYTWDPTLSGTGGYVTISWDGVSAYDITPASAQTQHIQSGQAFFVQATANAATTIAFEENDKSTSTIHNVFGVGNGQIDNLNINLKRIENGNLSTRDGVTASFGASYNKAVNFNEDAEKLFNNEEGITLKRGTNNLSIERRPFITNQNDTLFLALNRLQINTNYTLNINPQNFDAGMQAFLVDRLLSTETAINLQAASQDITITSSVATVADRWMIVFRGTGNLPNNKLSLVATKKDRDVQLTWNIANEQGVKEYELQRSVNGIEFTTINNQVASSKAEYNNVDTKANNGINYYRVKMTMLNDDVRYSNVVTINLKLSTVNPVTVYPNPIKGSIAQLQLNELAAGNYTIRLMDMQGKLVQTQNIQHQGGTTSRSLGLGNVAAGNYQLVVEGKGFTHTISVIKSN